MRDPRSRAPGARPNARLAHGPMAGGDGVQVRPGLRGPSIGPRLGASAALDRVDRQGEAWTASRRGPTTTVGPRHRGRGASAQEPPQRSEEHTSELQSQSNLVCRLLLEKKKQT